MPLSTPTDQLTAVRNLITQLQIILDNGVILSQTQNDQLKLLWEAISSSSQLLPETCDAVTCLDKHSVCELTTDLQGSTKAVCVCVLPYIFDPKAESCECQTLLPYSFQCAGKLLIPELLHNFEILNQIFVINF